VLQLCTMITLYKRRTLRFRALSFAESPMQRFDKSFNNPNGRLSEDEKIEFAYFWSPQSLSVLQLCTTITLYKRRTLRFRVLSFAESALQRLDKSIMNPNGRIGGDEEILSPQLILSFLRMPARSRQNNYTHCRRAGIS